MLRSLKELSGFAIKATDGEIGTVDDLYLDVETWRIRYVAVDTGRWLPGRRVLLAPVAIGRPDWENQKLPVQLTRQKVEESPEIETSLPIMRESEIRLHEHYMWEPYWLPGLGATIETLGVPGFAQPEEEAPTPETPETANPRLRGAAGLLGTDVEATDGAVGHLQDLLMDEMEWSVRMLVLDTGVWIAGRRVLVPVDWVSGVDLASGALGLDLSREQIQASPEYEGDRPLTPQEEAQLNAYYRAA